MHPELAQAWSSARGPGEHLHLDSAACSRMSLATRRAVAEHLDLEASVGGYVAEARVEPTLTRLRADLGSLTGFAADEISFAFSAADPMAQLLLSLQPRSAALLTGDYQRTVGALEHLGCTRHWLPVDAHRVLDLEALPGWLAREQPHVVILAALASHLGVAQPVVEATRLCREAGAVVIVDAAQAVGHLDLAELDADALVGTSRKWLAGPRGVGWLAVRSDLPLDVVPPWIRPEEWPDLPPHLVREPIESSIAGRLGLARAVREHLSAGPALVRERLAWLGARTREVLAGAGGWSVVEPVDTPTAITTLRPPAGVDVVAVRTRLIAEHGIVTTALLAHRALADAERLPALRVSPHVDATVEQLEQLAAAL